MFFTTLFHRQLIRHACSACNLNTRSGRKTLLKKSVIFLNSSLNVISSVPLCTGNLSLGQSCHLCPAAPSGTKAAYKFDDGMHQLLRETAGGWQWLGLYNDSLSSLYMRNDMMCHIIWLGIKWLKTGLVATVTICAHACSFHCLCSDTAARPKKKLPYVRIRTYYIFLYLVMWSYNND